MRDDGRYRIDDEPARMPFQGMELVIFIAFPATIFFTLTYSLFCLAIPGVLGVIIGGRHRWFDPLMCLACFVIFVIVAIVAGQLLDAGVDGLAAEYMRDISIALMFLPMVHVVMQQQRTLQLRRAVAL